VSHDFLYQNGGFSTQGKAGCRGQMTNVPPTITYASVSYRELVRFALLLAALNDLQVKAAGMMNDHITAPVERLR